MGLGFWRWWSEWFDSINDIVLISNPKKEKILCYQTYSLLNNSMFYIKRILSGKF